MASNPRLDVLKNNVVTSLFVDPADQDYALARMAYHTQMFRGFYWAAGQAIEKYLKASLLLNGESAKKYSHDLVKLFEAVSQYALGLFPPSLGKPSHLEPDPSWEWGEETAAKFLQRISKFTNPHNRYNVFGLFKLPGDLFYVDQFIFAARRVAVQLDAYPFLGKPKCRPGRPRTVRELLEKCSAYQPNGSPFDKPLKAASDLALRDAVLHLNFPFSPPEQDRERVPATIAVEFSVLDTRIFDLLDEGKASEKMEAAILADWIVENIKLPEDTKEKLCDAARLLRKAPE